MTTAPGPTVLDAASLLCEVADELVVRTVRDTHTAWVDRVHGFGRRATGATGASITERAHRGVATAVYATATGSAVLYANGSGSDARVTPLTPGDGRAYSADGSQRGQAAQSGRVRVRGEGFTITRS